MRGGDSPMEAAMSFMPGESLLFCLGLGKRFYEIKMFIFLQKRCSSRECRFNFYSKALSKNVKSKVNSTCVENE